MNYPRVQLHCHLDGAIPERLFVKYSREGGYVPEGVSDEEWIRQNVMTESMTLSEGLEKFVLLTAILQTKEHLTEVTETILDDYYEEGSRLVELRFAPQSHTEKEMDMEDAILAVLEGRKRAMEKHPDLVCGILVCIMNYGQEWGCLENNIRTVELAAKYKDQGVVGIDLAGDEMATPIESYAPQFEMAKQLGVNFTIHAGESGPASNVAFALSIGAKRIGHGIHSIQDERVVKEIIEKGVTLEVSPTSNVLSRCVPSYKEHPIRTFFDRGVRVNVNTDDPSLFGIRLEEEYQKLRETFHFTEKELALMNLYGAEASFCEGKEKIIEELKAYLAAAE